MKALSIVFQILTASSGVSAKRVGGVHINAVPQNDARPNVQLMLVSGIEEFTHSGPSGLIEYRVRIWCRGESVNATADLAQAVHVALQGFVGTVDGAAVQLIRRVMTTSDYDGGAKVHRSIADFEVSWGTA